MELQTRNIPSTLKNGGEGGIRTLVFVSVEV
jgi:hypothetical protein